MRQWMTIIAEGLEDELLAAAEKHKEIGMIRFDKNGSGADPEDWTETTPELVRARVEHYQKLFATGAARLYRIMWLPEAKVRELDAGESLGRFWSYDPTDLSTTALSGAEVEGEVDIYLFTASVPVDAVNWEETYRQNAELPWEHEVVLVPGKDITLEKIVQCVEPWGDTITSCRAHKAVRLDLTGQTFRA